MVSLHNKVVVITGASSGIGRAAATEFAKAGAKIVLASRTKNKLQQVQKDVKKAGGDCLIVPTDVTKEKEVLALFQKTKKTFGTVHVLVNNAGRGLKSPFHTIPLQEWNTTLHTNLTSVFLCTKHAVQLMQETNTKGHVITVSSMAGLVNVPGYSAYCSSKHAVTSFKGSIKWELWRSGIKSSTIHPYKVDTNFFHSYAKQPSKTHMLSPVDIAHVLVALAERNVFKEYTMRVKNLCKRVLTMLRLL